MKKLVLFAVIAGAIGAYFLFDLGQYFNLAYLKTQQDQLNGFYQENRALTIALYMLIYILMAALSLPGAAIMTLAGGAVFGLAFEWGRHILFFFPVVNGEAAFVGEERGLRN